MCLGCDYLLLAITAMERVYGFLQILLWVGSSLLPTLCVLFALSSPLLPACTISLLLPLCLPHILLSRCFCQCRCLREQPQFPVPPFLEEVLSATLFSSLSQKMRWDHQNIISPIPTHSPAPAHCCVQPQALCLLFSLCFQDNHSLLPFISAIFPSDCSKECPQLISSPAAAPASLSQSVQAALM